jgi:lysophospholipase L1-like esterase
MFLRARTPDRHFVWSPHRTQRFRPAPGAMPGVAGEAVFRVNSLGLRGDEPPPRGPRVLAIGGSSTECLYLDQTEAWPYLLQSQVAPAAWVGNAGRSGLDGRHHRLQVPILLAEVSDVRVVVLLLGANDLLRRLARDGEWRPSDVRSPAVRRSLLTEAFEAGPFRQWEGRWWERSVLLAALGRLRGRASPEVQDAAGAVYETWRSRRRSATDLRHRLPPLQGALEEYRQNLRAIGYAARGGGARLVLATQPALWRADLPAELRERLWMGGVGRFQSEPGHAYYSAAALRQGLDAYNATLLASCTELEDATCLDLAAAVPAEGWVFYDDVHFSEAGSRLVARLLAPAVERALGAGAPAARPGRTSSASRP